ncbi:MAG: hypothetical protein V1693_04700 [Nanoarchaeota archaeon]|nr:hypothetical protein [Nanoarchaeota archaeon]
MLVYEGHVEKVIPDKNNQTHLCIFLKNYPSFCFRLPETPDDIPIERGQYVEITIDGKLLKNFFEDKVGNDVTSLKAYLDKIYSGVAPFYEYPQNDEINA